MSDTKKLPVLSHQQFAVLSFMEDDHVTGKQLRAELGKFGIAASGPAFYQFMARMEEAKLVEGAYSQKIVDGQIIRQRGYWITPEGKAKLAISRAFYHPTP